VLTMNSRKAHRKPKQSLKAIRVYANPEQSQLIERAAEKENLSVSKFTLIAVLRCAAKVLRGVL
jgi:uncharacterized protein (DUF1778 family)